MSRVRAGRKASGRERFRKLRIVIRDDGGKIVDHRPIVVKTLLKDEKA